MIIAVDVILGDILGIDKAEGDVRNSHCLGEHSCQALALILSAERDTKQRKEEK